jgi:hypothetical protein
VRRAIALSKLLEMEPKQLTENEPACPPSHGVTGESTQEKLGSKAGDEGFDDS